MPHRLPRAQSHAILTSRSIRWRWPASPYLVAIASALAALVISFVSGTANRDVPPLLFLGAVAISAWYGGSGPGLLATICGFLALDYFFELPAYTLEISDPRTLLDSVAYLAIALLLGSLNAQLRRARARAEVALAEAEAAVRARDDALAAVSHDMRAPLTAIQATVAALEEDIAASDTSAHRLLLNIATASRRLEHFIGDALNLGRIDAGVRPNLTLNAPGEVVSAILDRYAQALGRRPLTFDVPDTLPLMLFDAGLLDQAVGNLLDNVATHTPPDTTVSVRGWLDEPHRFRLEVADSGPGIAADDRERIFDRFERLASGGTGAGLGLALARAAIRTQGGDLWVESSNLGGACFVLVLPVRRTSPAHD